MPVVTTLGFSGRTEEALAHYQHALNAETVYLLRFRDSPDQTHTQPGMEDKIFHATFRIDGTEFMASDIGGADAETPAEFKGFALALRFDSVNRARQAFDALADGGSVLIPLAESKFTSWYGIVIDRFGVSWKINVALDGGDP